MFNHIVNAVRERLDVRRIDRGEDSDAQLIASQRAISVHIDNAVVTQRLEHCGGRHRVQ